MLLFLVDDDDDHPFWTNIEDDAFNGWEVRRLTPVDCQDRGLPLAKEFLDRLIEIACRRKFFLITDANFGTDPNGGISLVNALCRRTPRYVQRACVYSTSPGTEPLIDTVKCILYDAGGPAGKGLNKELSEILEFFGGGRRPTPALSVAVRSLSSAIHAVENLILPIRVDLETLQKSSETARRVVASQIWMDYFGGIQGEGGRRHELGYFHPSKEFEGVPETGFENCLLHYLRRSVVGQSAAQSFAQIATECHTPPSALGELIVGVGNGSTSAIKLEEATGVKAARALGRNSFQRGQARMSAVLRDVLGNLGGNEHTSGLISILHAARDAAYGARKA